MSTEPKDWKIGDEPYYPVNDEKNQKIYDKYNNIKVETALKIGAREICFLDHLVPLKSKLEIFNDY